MMDFLFDIDEYDLFPSFGRFERPFRSGGSESSWHENYEKVLFQSFPLVDPLWVQHCVSFNNGETSAAYQPPPTSSSPKRHSTGDHANRQDVVHGVIESQRKRQRYVTTIPIYSEGAKQNQNSEENKQKEAIKSSSSDKSLVSKWPFDVSGLGKKEVRVSVRAYFSTLWDVPADGNCGYYVLLDYLQRQGLLPATCVSVRDLRRILYDFAVQHQDKLLSKGSYFYKQGYWKVSHDHDGTLSKQVFHQDISKIYNPSADFEEGCHQEYWMTANIVMPLVAMRFGINIWVLSADGDPYFDPSTGRALSDKPYTTMYTLIHTGDVSREIVKDTVAFPIDTPGDESSAPYTAYVIHVKGNHYIGAER